MLNKNRALSLFLMLTSVNVASAANIALSVSGVDNSSINTYLSKAKTQELLQRELSIISETNKALANDLQIASIADYLSCQTVVGRDFLNNVLSAPISPKSDCGVVASRQALIKKLVDDVEFKELVDSCLLQAKDAEKGVIELFDAQFRGKTCPKEANIKMLKEQKALMYPFVKFMELNPVGKYYFTVTNLAFTACGAYYAPRISKMIYAAHKNKLLSSKQYLYIAYGALMYGAIGYETVEDYINAAKKRDKMHCLSKLVAIAEQAEALCVEHSIKQQFKFSSISNKDSIKLIQELKKSRYTQEKSYLFLTPSVHLFLYDIYEKDNCFSEIFATIAELDACNAIATKILANQDGKNQFCFAQFLDQAQPEINTVNSWNVLVGEQKAVANSLHETKNILLSGVNAGGKTTYTRSILQNIVLAQTFGVAAAEKFEFTPFDIIGSYLNISDDLLAGNSLFVSEVKRAQEIKLKIDSINGSNLKYFFALDELFTGTGADAGEQCACDFVSRIANSENTMFIYPTHFDKLKDLGVNHPKCANYKVDSATKKQDGSLVYPFTVSQGASYDNIALDIARNANLFS